MDEFNSNKMKKSSVLQRTPPRKQKDFPFQETHRMGEIFGHNIPNKRHKECHKDNQRAKR